MTTNSDFPSRRPARVLLVDDEVALLNATTRLLQRAGYVVVGASDAETALTHMDEYRFDVVISDIAMPRMDGIQFLRVLRERDQDVPVVLVTGAPDLESATEAVAHGAFQYLIKPVENQKLLDAAARATKLSRLASMKRAAQEKLGTGFGVSDDPMALEASFERALSSLWMAFQPIVSTQTREVFGYEALLRTREPALPHPEAVIDAAERLEALYDLGRLSRALIAEAAQSCEHNFFVNLHPSDLADPDLISSRAALSARPEQVVLEITERASLAGVSGVRSRIAELRAMGFRIAVDDLGAGYAGLASFAQLEPDIVKLDMSLVRGVDKSTVKQKLVRSMTSVCQDLGLLVVGEGVETTEERDALVEYGCDLLQGYRFGKPGPPFVEASW